MFITDRLLQMKKGMERAPPLTATALDPAAPPPNIWLAKGAKVGPLVGYGPFGVNMAPQPLSPTLLPVHVRISWNLGLGFLTVYYRVVLGTFSSRRRARAALVQRFAAHWQHKR
jgi:hypothetical protein